MIDAREAKALQESWGEGRTLAGALSAPTPRSKS